MTPKETSDSSGTTVCLLMGRHLVLRLWLITYFTYRKRNFIYRFGLLDVETYTDSRSGSGVSYSFLSFIFYSSSLLISFPLFRVCLCKDFLTTLRSLFGPLKGRRLYPESDRDIVVLISCITFWSLPPRDPLRFDARGS